eukprot:5511662-Ditylum_brightwellii.AAC.1
MDYAAWVYSHMPTKENGLSSNDIWLRSKDPRLKDTLGRTHVWGAPTYVLEPLRTCLDTLCKTPSCRIQVPLYKGVSPELNEEWLTEGEALAKSTAECQEILRSSGSPGANFNEGTLPSQLEDSPNSSLQ